MSADYQKQLRDASEAAKAVVLDFIIDQCEKRRQIYAAMTPLPDDPEEVQHEKMEFCLDRLRVWSGDPLRFIDEAGWVPDPQGFFGGRGQIPERLAPARMVPILMGPAQRAAIQEIDTALESVEPFDVNLLKTRQVAGTGLILSLIKNKYLFAADFKAILGSYEEDVIDGGGAGHREGDSLFARFRMMLDAFAWCFGPNFGLPYSTLRFNQHIPKSFILGKTASADNVCWLGKSDDVTKKVKRPRWVVFGGEIFKGARGNLILGKLPSDKFAKSDTFALALYDEYGELDKIGPGVDKKAYDAAGPCVRCRVTLGTVPEGGGHASHFKALHDKGDTPTLKNIELDWTDVAVYMIGAFYSCERCGTEPIVDAQPFRGRPSMYGPETPGPGLEGVEKTCEHCGHVQWITQTRVSSPFFERVKDRLNFDPVSLARYYRRNFDAAQSDRFFYTFDRERAYTRRPVMQSGSFMLDGLDPGYSTTHPMAWMLVEFDIKRQRPRAVGYWMAANTLILYWVPFLKRWSVAQMRRQRMPHGMLAGEYQDRPWAEAFRYSEKALAMMERVSRYSRGGVLGDKFGSHHNQVASPYSVLNHYGINVDWEYTKDREALCRDGVEWAARLEIDEEIADVQPESATGVYPSLRQIFETAQPKQAVGQAALKFDVDKQTPPHVSHGADTWLYIVRALTGDVREIALPDGGYELETAANLGGWDLGADHSLD
jgi:hypothetical protein